MSGNCYTPFLFRVFELPMTAFLIHFVPAVLFNCFYHISNLHSTNLKLSHTSMLIKYIRGRLTSLLRRGALSDVACRSLFGLCLFPPPPFCMVHKWNSTTVICKLIESIMGELIYSPALGASESNRAARLKTFTRPNVFIALAGTLTATAGRKGGPPEHQKGVRQQQQEERQDSYHHTVCHPTDCAMPGHAPDDCPRQGTQDEPNQI